MRGRRNHVRSGLSRRSQDLSHRIPVPGVGRDAETSSSQIGGHWRQVRARFGEPQGNVIGAEVRRSLDGLRHDGRHHSHQYHLEIQWTRDLEDEGKNGFSLV
jgi:hypothetical protein